MVLNSTSINLQIMSETAESPAKLKTIQNGYAMDQDDIYRNKPFHGTIFRVQGGQKIYLDYISQDERLTLSQFLGRKNINEGVFLLDTRNEQGQPVNIEFRIDKSGEGKQVSNPFLSNYNGQSPQKTENSGMSSALKEEMEAQILRLSNNLQEADRKNRQLTDELLEAKRELSKDNTEKMLAHKDEVRKLEKEHDKTVRELEKEISELKTEIKFKELEYKSSDRDGLTRLFDFFEENGESLFAGIIQSLQKAGQNPNVTPQQLQAAVIEQAKAKQQAENAAETQQASENTEENEEIQDSEETADPEAQNPQPPALNEEQKMAFKNSVSAKLLDTALMVLSDKNADLQKYAQFVRDQMAIMNQSGVSLDAKQWVEMAKALAERAIDEKITAERVAKVIRPVLDGVKGYAFMLKMVSADKATEQLFNQFNIEANEQVKKLVTKVLKAVQQSL